MSVPLTAKVIIPLTLTDPMILSSTIAEPDTTIGESAWVSGASYTAGQQKTRSTTHKVYKALTNHTGVATLPENDGTNWQDIGYTNKYRSLDNKVGTSSTQASGDLTYVLQPGYADGLAAMELTGRELEVSAKNAPGGTVIYGPHTIDLDGSLVEDVYDWFFSDYEQRRDVVLTNLPRQYGTAEITIKVKGTAGTSIGVLKLGKVEGLGSTMSGAQVGIISYSTKEADAFGNIEVVSRSYSKRNNYKVLTNASDFNRVFRRLASIRDIPCIFIGTESVGYEPMLVYGFYKSFSIDVAYTRAHLCDLEIEGLI